MTKDTYSIGSVILSNNVKCLVVGVVFDDKDNKLLKKYLVVPFPLGFLDSESLRAVDPEEAELVCEGYRCETTSNFVDYLNKLDNLSDLADAKTIRSLTEAAYEKYKET